MKSARWSELGRLEDELALAVAKRSGVPVHATVAPSLAASLFVGAFNSALLTWKASNATLDLSALMDQAFDAVTPVVDQLESALRGAG